MGSMAKCWIAFVSPFNLWTTFGGEVERSQRIIVESALPERRMGFPERVVARRVLRKSVWDLGSRVAPEFVVPLLPLWEMEVQ
jgi:hypothetical protein